MRLFPHRLDPRLAARLVATAVALYVAAIAPAWGQSPTAAPASRGSTGAKVSELVKSDVKLGTGTEAVAGKTVVVHYTGWLHAPEAAEGHGAKFDSSLDRGTPFSFVLGAGRVIRGWDEGVAGMKVGGKRTLVIPAHLGYGARGAGGVIPPDATLVFDVDLIEVKG